MYKAKLCMGISRSFKPLLGQQIPMLKKIGFEAFFSEWEEGQLQKQLRQIADETGMIYQSIHAPFGKMNTMWIEGNAGDAAAQELCRCVEDCAQNGVPIMVAHTFIGFKDHSPSPQGIENFGKVVERAEKCGVKVAFENTEGEEYLAAVLNAFEGNPNVGFCWDTGHEMCYNRSRDMLALYGKQLICTHINDNLGIRDFGGEITYIDDLHLLPFDGIADWQGVAARLNTCGYDDILTFELNVRSKPGRTENTPYSRLTGEEYFTECYKRACRVAALKIRDAEKNT